MIDIRQILQTSLIYIVDLYSMIFGDVYLGYFDQKLNYHPNSGCENILTILPSFINHLYGKLFSTSYLYSNKNLIYSSLYGNSTKITMPIMSCKEDINNSEAIDYKPLFTKFSNNVPFLYIFKFYSMNPENLTFKYIKGGIKTKTFTNKEILEKTLENIVNE